MFMRGPFKRINQLEEGSPFQTKEKPFFAQKEAKEFLRHLKSSLLKNFVYIT